MIFLYTIEFLIVLYFLKHVYNFIDQYVPLK